MKVLLEYLVKNLVQYPDEVEIKEEGSDNNIILWLKANPIDLGKIIGKRGKTITALRNLLRLKGLLTNKKIDLQLIDKKENQE